MQKALLSTPAHFASERITLEKLELVRKHQINTDMNIFVPFPGFRIFVDSSTLNLVNTQL